MRWVRALYALFVFLWLMIFAAIMVMIHSHPARAQALSTWRNSALIKLHKSDVDVLARTLYGEARGEHLDGMIAVAWVVLNRAKRGPPRFPSTIAGVCKQPNQFTCWSPSDPNAKVCAAASDADPFFVLATFAAAGVLSGQFKDTTKGSDHYHTIGMRPYPVWASKMELQAIIGQHRFYKE